MPWMANAFNPLATRFSIARFIAGMFPRALDLAVPLNYVQLTLIRVLGVFDQLIDAPRLQLSPTNRSQRRSASLLDVELNS